MLKMVLIFISSLHAKTQNSTISSLLNTISIKRVLKMAMRLELTSKAENELALIMTELGIKTKTKAITFLISQYLLLEKQLKQVKENRDEYRQDLNILIKSIKQKEKAEQIIQRYAISKNKPNAETIKALQDTSQGEEVTIEELRSMLKSGIA